MNTKFDEYLEFPCPFTFKVMGAASEQLVDEVVNVVQRHAPGDYSPSVRPSAKGNYHSVSISVMVTSKEHIEGLYQELADIETVVMVL